VTPPAGTDTERIPVRYWIWLLGAAVSLLGDLIMTFALGWSASHYGGRTAGLVLLLAAAPRAVLLLIGGAVGDRFGAHRVLLASCVAMFTVTAALVPTTLAIDEPVGLLMVVALLVGTIDAFFLPSSRAMPRLLVPRELIPRAVASYQVVGVVFAVSGTAIGGLIVGVAGFPAAAGADAITFGVMIMVLIYLSRGIVAPKAEVPLTMFRSIVEGLKAAFGNPLTKALLIVMTISAGLMMPQDALLLPLLARDHGWSAETAGLVIACRSVGVGVIALRIVIRGAFRRPGVMTGIGMVVAGSGMFGLSVADSVWLTAVSAAVSGCGTGMFTGHILPMLMNSMEQAYQSRLQSVIVLCQSIAVVIMNPLMGSLSDAEGIGITGVCLGIGVAATLLGVATLSRSVIRNAPA
jgi:MFS family permease